MVKSYLYVQLVRHTHALWNLERKGLILTGNSSIRVRSGSLPRVRRMRFGPETMISLVLCVAQVLEGLLSVPVRRFSAGMSKKATYLDGGVTHPARRR